MRKYILWLLVVALFCMLTAGGCGGGSDGDPAGDDSGQVESFNEETGQEQGTDEGRGTSGSTVDLSTLNEHYTAQNGDILTGTLDAILMVSVADGATVTLRDAAINGRDDPKSGWAGLTCRGDATIILEGKNNVKGFFTRHPGIYVPQGKTLTIKGDGELTARGSSMASGIGGGWDLSCGNIVIDSGTITAYGEARCAGIGTGLYGYPGLITINGGKITAVKGEDAGFSVGPGYWNDSHPEITLGGVKYKASENIFTYGLEPNTTGKFKVDIDVAGAYNTNVIAFYGRKSLGLNEDGSYKLGGWEKLQEWKGSWLAHTYSQSFEVSRKYVELGFEFDIAAGTDWPYSGVFWTADKTLNEQVDSVFIDFGGGIRTSNIEIKVNGKRVFYDSNISSHEQYKW